MASNRHLGRIVALQTLYEQEFRLECGDGSFEIDEVLNRNILRYSETIEDKDFIVNLTKGVFDKMNDLDEALKPLAPDWPIAQIARMDRIVLRIGLYELTYSTSVPPKVAINEAVELAKAFGGDNSSKFVNGVLGTAYRQKEGVTEEKPTKKIESKTKSASGGLKPKKKVTKSE